MRIEEKVDKYLNETRKTEFHKRYVKMAESNNPFDFLEGISEMEDDDYFRDFMEFLRNKIKRGNTHKKVENAFFKYLDKYGYEI